MDVGRASRIFLEKHPELAWFLGETPGLRRLARWAPPARVLGWAVHLLDKGLGLPLPGPLYEALLRTNYAAGAAAREDGA